MKTLLPLFVGALLFAGCERIEGQLNVTQDVKLKTTKGVLRTVRVGTYSADIKANTKKKITLRLNNDADEKYEFNVPNGSIPSNGSFAYGPEVLGQPVNMKGVVTTVVSDSERRQTTESCQYQEPVQVCYPVPNGGVACSIQYQTRFGTRWIQYFDRTTNRDVALSISAVNSDTESATFNGETTWVERVVLNATQCR